LPVSSWVLAQLDSPQVIASLNLLTFCLNNKPYSFIAKQSGLTFLAHFFLSQVPSQTKISLQAAIFCWYIQPALLYLLSPTFHANFQNHHTLLELYTKYSQYSNK
jgi:hypothetical protein